MAFYLATPGQWVRTWQEGGDPEDAATGRVLYVYDGDLVGEPGRTYSVVARFDEADLRRLVKYEAYHCRPEVHVMCEDVTGDERRGTVPVDGHVYMDLVTLATAEPDFNARVDELFGATCASLGITEFKPYSERRASYETRRMERNIRREENQRRAQAVARLQGIRQDMANLMLWTVLISMPAYDALEQMVREDNPAPTE